MSIEIEIEFNDADEAKKYLDEGNKKFQGKLKTALAESGLYMLKSVDTNFRVGGRPKWPALKQTTIANRRLGSSKPLQDTGRLKQSITMQSSADSVSIGTNVVYSRIHQFGGSINMPEIRPRRARALSWVTPLGQRVFAQRVRGKTIKIPARPYLLFQREDVEFLEKIFLRHIDESFQLKVKGGENK